VDFISIDTESYNQEVLEGNDWGKYRPRLICIEGEEGAEYGKFLAAYGYRHLSFNGLNHFYADKAKV
jgi:hypothetical protein